MARELIILLRFKRDYENARQRPDFDVEIWGAAAFAIVSPIQTRVMQAAAEAPAPDRLWFSYSYGNVAVLDDNRVIIQERLQIGSVMAICSSLIRHRLGGRVRAGTVRRWAA